MGMAVGGEKGVLADMNVVPLIDILLVLIIIFMVITPTTPKGLETAVPAPSTPTAPVSPERVIVVQVLAGGQVRINEESSNWDSLGSRLEEIFKLRAEKVAFVRGDSDVSFEDVARAIGIMRTSGIERVGLMIEGNGRS